MEQLEDRAVPTATVVVGLNGPSSMMAGGQIAYTLNVSNMGPDAAQNIDLTDLLPSGVSFAWRAQASGPAFSLGYSGGQVSDTIAALPADTSASFSVIVSVPSNTPNNTSLVDQAGVTTTTQLSGSSITSASVTTTVQNNSAPAGTSLALTSSANPSPFGQAVTFTAVVASAAGGTPTGTVSFADGGTSLGTATLSVVNGQDRATLSTSALATGSHTITASYGGDNNFWGSGGSLTQIVQSPALTWTGPTFTWGQGQAGDPTLVNPGDQINSEGNIVSLPLSANSPQGYPLTYAALGLPPGLTLDPRSGIISGTITNGAADSNGGVYQASIVVADDHGGSTTATFAWAVSDTNRPPSIDPIPDQSSQAGSDVQVQVVASDPDGQEVLYTATGLPPGLTMSPLTGTISGTIDPLADGGAYAVTVTASDLMDQASESFAWNVTANPQSDLSNPGDQISREGDAVSLQITAIGPNEAALTFAADGLPDGLAIDADTGLISGTVAPDTADADGHNVTITVDDGTVAVSQSLVWVVTPYVSFTQVPDQSSAEGDTVYLTLSASAPAGTVEYSADGLPDGLSIGATSGIISGTIPAGASSQGPYIVDLWATDGDYATSQEISWAVTRAGDSAPVLANPGSQTGAVGDQVSLAISASDPDGDALSFSATGLPDGLSIDPASGEITGTLTEAAAEASPASPVVVSADDGHGSTATVSFSWTVQDAIPSLSPVPSLTAAEGQPLQDVLLATVADPAQRPEAWFTASINWGDGAVSDGTVLTTDETPGGFGIYGTHAYAHPGTYAISIELTDPLGNTIAGDGSAVISQAPLSLLGGLSISDVTGDSTPRDLALISDTNPLLEPGDYTAMVSWGDGTSSPGQVGGSYGSLLVQGGHAYQSSGDYTVIIQVQDSDGRMASATSVTHVGFVEVGQAAQFSLGTFATTDPLASASAVINWGDGSTGAGTIVGTANSFSVQGSHVYTGPGNYQVEVTVSTASGGSVVAQDTLRVVPVSVAALSDPLLEYGSTGSPQVVAVFASGDPTLSAAQLSATVNWGDGTTGPATQILQAGVGLFEVVAGPAYTGLPAITPVVQLFAGTQLVKFQPGEKDPPKVEIGRPIPANISLASVLENNFKKWADLLPRGATDKVLSLDKINQMIGSNDVTMEDAAAVAILKVYVYQAPDDLKQPGAYKNVFTNAGASTGYLAKADIDQFAAILQDTAHKKYKKELFDRATTLNNLFMTALQRIATRPSKDVLFATPPRGQSPDNFWQNAKQGIIGDCSFVSATIALAKTKGQKEFKGRIRAAGVVGGVQQYDVDLYNATGGKVTITVARPTDAEFALYSSTSDGSVWLPVFEKAYITKWFSTQPPGYMGLNSYSLYDVAANGERVDQAIFRVTGNAAKWRVPGNVVLDRTLIKLLDGVNKGKAVVVGSKVKGKMPADGVTAGVPTQHAFAVVGFDPKTNTITLRNPWDLPGTWGSQKDISLTDFKNWFNIISVEGTTE